ncbi:zinc finger protein 532-like [Biomphalaria glabrata]|uniref:Zinc finger protein 532-like n=1 Tax=Biomphalaria glabrata TaxID=6526 RepID=A0A9U8EG74_BIOGL|nr:zinc finger protein 532-like [Biomphalaria glabrata]
MESADTRSLLSNDNHDVSNVSRKDSVLGGNSSPDSSRVTGIQNCFVVDLNKNKWCISREGLKASSEKSPQSLSSKLNHSSSLDSPFVIKLDDVKGNTTAQDLGICESYGQGEKRTEQSESEHDFGVCSQSETNGISTTPSLPCEDLQIDLISSESSSSVLSATDVDSINGARIIDTEKSSDFQPIILDVRGSCSDSIFDMPEDSDNPWLNDTSVPPKTSSYIGQGAVDTVSNITTNTQDASINVDQSSMTLKSQSEKAEQEIAYSDRSRLKTLLNLAEAITLSSEGSSTCNSFVTTNSSCQTDIIPVSYGNPVVSSPLPKVSSNLNSSKVCVVPEPEIPKLDRQATHSIPKGNSSSVPAKNIIRSSPTESHVINSESSFSHDKLSVNSTLAITKLSKNQSSNLSVTTELTPAERVQRFVDTALARLTINIKYLRNSDVLKLKKLPIVSELQNSCTDFRCLVCKECFQLQDGLDSHYKRTSFYLKYACRVCGKSLLFYNKCQLHLHVRNHKPETSVLYNDVVSLIPYDPETSPVGAASGSGSTKNARVFVTASPSKRKNCEQLDQNKKKVCDKQYTKKCFHCNMFLHSATAFETHCRLHEAEPSNYACPECGETNFNFKESSSLESKRQIVFDHVDKCQHFNRVDEIRCECQETSTDNQQMVQHYLDKHLSTLYKCQLCNLRFSTLAKAVVHHTKVHYYISARIMSILVCSLCDVFLNNSNILKIHAENHVRQMHFKAAESKWQCFLCPTVFADKEELDKHCNSQHTHKAKRCTICFALFSNRKNLVDHILLKKCAFSPSTCFEQCVDVERPVARVDYNRHFKFFTLPGSSTSSAAYVRIAPKDGPSLSSSNAVSILNSVKDTRGSANSLSVSKQQNVNRSSQDNEASHSNPQQSLLNVHMAPKSTRASGSADHPVIVNKKLTFQKSGAIIISQAADSSKPHSKDESNLNLYECEQCKAYIIGKSTYEKHLQNHIPSQLKKYSQNTSTPPSSLSQPNKSQDLFLQCHQCRIVFIGQNRYDDHIKNHIKKGDLLASLNETKCVICKSQVLNSMLLSHLKSHQTEGTIVCARCQRTDFETMEMAVNHANHFCGYTIMTGIGVSVQKSGAKRRAQTTEKQSNDAEKDKAINFKKVNKNNEASLFPCLLCGLAFLNLEARDEHISRLHDGIRVIYRCLKCQKKDVNKTFSKKESVVRHLVKKHRVVKKASVDKFIKVEERNASSGQTIPEFQSSVSSPSLPPKRLRLADNGDYMCGKCGFSCSSSAEFSQHIQTHNADKQPQCPECGLCFVVVSALKKHLFAVHKIKNVDNYLKSKEISVEQLDEEEPIIEVFPLPLPPKVECPSPVTVKKAVNPLECTVCYKVFDNEPNLKTHMRNHGMAFIRSKRLKID